MKCKNCNAIVRKNFCYTCGQSVRVGKITYKSILGDLFQGIFYIKNGFLFTLKALFVRPGEVIHAFLDGQRKRYFKPVVYVLILSTFHYLIVHWVGDSTWIESLISGMMENVNSSINITVGNKKPKIPDVFIWFSKNYAYLTLLSVPLFSLASWLAFLGLKAIYFEHFVLNLYTTGQQAIIYAFFTLIYASFKSDFLESLSSIIAILYVFVVFWKFFKSENRILNILRTIIAYIIYAIVSMAILVTIFILNQPENYLQ